MDATVRPGNKPISPGFLDLYTLKLVTVSREGYGWRSLQADAIAGLTVAVVALPLSMAIGRPERTIRHRLRDHWRWPKWGRFQTVRF